MRTNFKNIDFAGILWVCLTRTEYRAARIDSSSAAQCAMLVGQRQVRASQSERRGHRKAPDATELNGCRTDACVTNPAAWQAKPEHRAWPLRSQSGVASLERVRSSDTQSEPRTKRFAGLAYSRSRRHLSLNSEH